MRTSTSRPLAEARAAPGQTPAARIRQRALEVGFDAVGIASPASVGRAGHRFREFLGLGRQGDMAWLEAKAARRADPLTLWPEVRAIVMVGQNYGPESDPLEILQLSSKGAISVYAQGLDYHDVVKKRLKALGGWLGAEFDAEIKVFVDTAPVLEKPLAEAAGIGWQGKHSNLVSREFGSWLFLGAIFTTLRLPPDAPGSDHCGDCRRCLEICPTAAFPAPYQLDARRCISYLTIEHPGPIPLEFREPMGNRIFGCDDCLAVCPWNKFATKARDARLLARETLIAPSLGGLARLDDAEFRRLFTKSPVKRMGRARFIRNVLIAIGNSGDDGLAGTAEALLADPSGLIRGMAVWALRRLRPGADFEALRRRHREAEKDPEVRTEWDRP